MDLPEQPTQIVSPDKWNEAEEEEEEEMEEEDTRVVVNWNERFFLSIVMSLPCDPKNNVNEYSKGIFRLDRLNTFKSRKR